MRQSQQVLNWQAEARAKAEAEVYRKFILRLLELRFTSPVPADLVTAVNALADINERVRWFDTAATAPSLDAFRAAVGL